MTSDLAARCAMAENLGMRISDALLRWCETDDICHLVRKYKLERECEEWINTRYHPELLP